MGQILSQPVTEKSSESGNTKNLAYGLSSMQGWRINMEDAHATITNMKEVNDYIENDQEIEEKEDSVAYASEIDDSTTFFGVYDGHGGEKAAIFTGDHLHELVKSTNAFKQGDYVNALKEGFLSCDQAILKDFYMRDDDSGCAATSIILNNKQIYCGNAGDSRTIMSINGFAKALSYDHKPSNEGEKARICSAGGYVDMGRVNGNLALSRGIGDFEFKKNLNLPAEEQIVTCYPDVLIHNIDYSQDEFIVLACDGIWDCLTSQNCVECIRRGIYENKTLTTICEELMELCCAPTSDGSGIGCDNMSVVIIALLDESKQETLEDWYKKIIARIDNQKSQITGSISSPYNEIYKEMYGEMYDIGRHNNKSQSNSQGGFNGSVFGKYDYDVDEDNDIKDNDETRNNPQDITSDPDVANGAISLQKLLSSNAVTNENGVIYLDTSSAQSLLAHFGMNDNGEGNHEEEDDDLVHDKHIEDAEVEDDEAGEEEPEIDQDNTSESELNTASTKQV